MRRASRRFTDHTRERINRAVGVAESRTQAEIVPVVATTSGRYDRPEDVAGLVTALVGLGVVWLLFQREDPAAAGWGGLPLAVPFWVLLVVIVLGFVGGAAVAARVAAVRRLFTPRRQMDDEVGARARALFYDRRIHHTDGGHGLLLYVSLFERRAVLLADQGVEEAAGPDLLAETCEMLCADLRNDELVEGLLRAIEHLGNQLAEKLPREGAPKDELPNALVTVE